MTTGATFCPLPQQGIKCLCPDCICGAVTLLRPVQARCQQSRSGMLPHLLPSGKEKRAKFCFSATCRAAARTRRKDRGRPCCELKIQVAAGC